MSKDIQCQNCPRKFAERSHVYQHIKAKHHGKGKGAFVDDDESFADRAIAASLAVAMGEHTDDDWLLP